MTQFAAVFCGDVLVTGESEAQVIKVAKENYKVPNVSAIKIDQSVVNLLNRFGNIGIMSKLKLGKDGVYQAL